MRIDPVRFGEFHGRVGLELADRVRHRAAWSELGPLQVPFTPGFVLAAIQLGALETPSRAGRRLVGARAELHDYLI